MFYHEVQINAHEGLSRFTHLFCVIACQQQQARCQVFAHRRFACVLAVAAFKQSFAGCVDENLNLDLFGMDQTTFLAGSLGVTGSEVEKFKPIADAMGE